MIRPDWLDKIGIGDAIRPRLARYGLLVWGGLGRAYADQTFLGRAGNQASIAGEDLAAIKAARAFSPGAVGHI